MWHARDRQDRQGLMDKKGRGPLQHRVGTFLGSQALEDSGRD